MTFYSNLSNTAVRLIKQFGQPCIVPETTKANDPVTGSVTETLVKNHTVNVVEVDYSQAFGGSQDNAKQDAIYLLADSSYALDIGMKMQLDGESLFIKRLKKIRPGGEILAYGVEVMA